MPKKRSAKKSVAKAKPRLKPRAAASGEYAAVFKELKKVLSAFAPELRVISDEPQKYYLVTQSNSWKNGPLAFGAVIVGRAYVSYHLTPLYVCPELAKTVSSDLKKRMQGKACFNFQAPDAGLFAELADLTKAGLEKFRAKNWL